MVLPNDPCSLSAHTCIKCILFFLHDKRQVGTMPHFETRCKVRYHLIIDVAPGRLCEAMGTTCWVLCDCLPTVAHLNA